MSPKARIATALTTTTTVWGSRYSSRTGVVVRPKPKPIAAMVNAAMASTTAEIAISMGSGMGDRIRP